MKKLTAVIITFVALFGVCFGAAGCKNAEKDTINYTATAPAVYYKAYKNNNNE